MQLRRRVGAIRFRAACARSENSALLLWALCSRSTPDDPELLSKAEFPGFAPKKLLPGYYRRRANDRFRSVVRHRVCRIAVGRLSYSAGFIVAGACLLLITMDTTLNFEFQRY